MGPRCTYLFLEFGIFFLSMNQIEDDIECSGEYEGKEEAESGEIGVSLRAKQR